MSREGCFEIKYRYYGCIFQLAPHEDRCKQQCTRNCWKTLWTNGRRRLTSGEKTKISLKPLELIKVLTTFFMASLSSLISCGSDQHFSSFKFWQKGVFCIPQQNIACSYFLFSNYWVTNGSTRRLPQGHTGSIRKGPGIKTWISGSESIITINRENDDNLFYLLYDIQCTFLSLNNVRFGQGNCS